MDPCRVDRPSNSPASEYISPRNSLTRDALALARRIVGNLNRKKNIDLVCREPVDPLYDAKDIYGLLPTDIRQPFDVREIIARISSHGSQPSTEVFERPV